eukprot:934537-Prymnesium_polylepis.1
MPSCVVPCSLQRHPRWRRPRCALRPSQRPHCCRPHVRVGQQLGRWHAHVRACPCRVLVVLARAVACPSLFCGGEK